MDLYKIIPQNDSRWVVSKNIIYIDYFAKIPILVKSGDDIWVYMDVKILKYVLKLIKILEKQKIEFLFKSTSIFFDHKFDESDIHTRNLSHYLMNISNPNIFDGIEKIGFDYTRNIASYLLAYECYDIFQDVYKKVSKKLLSKTYDYYTNKDIFQTNREDIRNYISSLEREIKISILF